MNKGEPDWWSYIVLLYMEATKFDPAKQPSLQDWFEMDFLTRKKQTELISMMVKVFDEIIKGMNSMKSTQTVQKQLKEFSKVHAANSLVEEADKSDKEAVSVAQKQQNKQMEAARKATIATQELFIPSPECPHPCMRMVFNGSGAVSLREKKAVNNLKIVMAVDDLIHENAANAGVFICNKVFTLASQCEIISKDAVIDDLTTKLMPLGIKHAKRVKSLG